MRTVGIGAKENKEQAVPYEIHMRAVEEIERLQVLCASLQEENKNLKADYAAQQVKAKPEK